MSTIYEKAKKAIAKNPKVWPNGHIITLAKTGAKTVYITTGPSNSYRLDLVYQNGSKSKKVKVGFYSIKQRRWTSCLSRPDYEAWVRSTGHEPNAVEEVKTPERKRFKFNGYLGSVEVAPRLMCAELRAEWQAAGGI